MCYPCKTPLPRYPIQQLLHQKPVWQDCKHGQERLRSSTVNSSDSAAAAETFSMKSRSYNCCNKKGQTALHMAVKGVSWRRLRDLTTKPFYPSLFLSGCCVPHLILKHGADYSLFVDFEDISECREINPLIQFATKHTMETHTSSLSLWSLSLH